MGANFWGGNLVSKIFWNEFLQVGNISFWEEQNTGEQKCFGEKDMGRKFLGAKKSLGGKICRAKFGK